MNLESLRRNWRGRQRYKGWRKRLLKICRAECRKGLVLGGSVRSFSQFSLRPVANLSLTSASFDTIWVLDEIQIHCAPCRFKVCAFQPRSRADILRNLSLVLPLSFAAPSVQLSPDLRPLLRNLQLFINNRNLSSGVTVASVTLRFSINSQFRSTSTLLLSTPSFRLLLPQSRK